MRTLKLTDILEVVRAVRHLHRMDERQSHRMTNAEHESLTGKARMNAYKDRTAETERVKERKRARVERGAEDAPTEPGNRDDEQMAVRHADAVTSQKTSTKRM